MKTQSDTVAMPMTAESIAQLADDLASMAADITATRDTKTLRNMAENIARLIRQHLADPQKGPTMSIRDVQDLHNEPGELGVAYNATHDAFELTLCDLNQRPIACMSIPAPLLERAIADKRDYHDEHPYVGLMFHVHTLKELIAP